MIHADFENLLQQAIGLDPASIGSCAVERAVKERLSVCGIDDPAKYLERVRASATELQALIDAVIVPETWFFREPEAFQELARIATQEWLPGNRQGTLRLLSVPCSSGEEPYSMVMALLDAGFPQQRCRVDAVDISTQGLSTARDALYRKNSFRGADLTFRDRYFDSTALGFRLSQAVLNHVHFHHGNVLASDFMAEAARYDIIFCRNLLIYFDRTTQDRAVEVFKRLLTPDGVLFVGPSEGAVLLNHGFGSCKVPLAFAHRRSALELAAIVPAPSRALVASVSDAQPVSLLRALANSCVVANSAAPAPASEGPVHAGFKLADQGRMTEAAQACEDHLRQHGPSVQSFFLLGVIQAAAGNLNEARQYYRKALYLDRDHQDTLLHLRLLLEKQGDARGAKVIVDRLQRLEQKRTA